MKVIQPGSARPSRQASMAVPVGLMLCFCLGLHAVPQGPTQTPAVKDATTPSSALMRWWERLNRQKVTVQGDDQSLLIKETGWSVPERAYQRTQDAEGRIHEIYRENGQLKPVDEGVRRWVDTTLKASRRQPPLPPLPPEPPLPPVPPAPPEPPRESLLEPARAAFETYQTDARLIALLGTPITREAQVKGSIRTWGRGEPHGFHLFSPTGGAKAEVKLILHGPKGSALLLIQGERKGKGNVWSFSRLEAQPSQGGTPLNLLAK